MEFSEFVRKPFKIEAVQITDENMDELCELIGHEVRNQGDNRFIVVNRKIVPNGYRAFVGWWVTQMGDNLRCYPKRVFNEQFIPMGPEWDSWFTDEEVQDDSFGPENVQTEVLGPDEIHADALPASVISPEVEDIGHDVSDNDVAGGEDSDNGNFITDNPAPDTVITFKED